MSYGPCSTELTLTFPHWLGATHPESQCTVHSLAATSTLSLASKVAIKKWGPTTAPNDVDILSLRADLCYLIVDRIKPVLGINLVRILLLVVPIRSTTV